MILKAKQLGVTPFELLNAQYAALKADDTNNELRNLDESQINDFLKPGLAVVKTLKEAGANDLLYLINRVGMDNLSTNQIERIDNYLASVAYRKGAQEEDVARQEQEHLNAVKQRRLKRLNTLGIENVPASALESDEAMDAFIIQQGLLESQY